MIAAGLDIVRVDNLARVVHLNPIGEYRHASRIFVEHRHRLLQHLFGQRIVAIKQRDVFTRGHPDADVARHPDAPILLIDHANPIAEFCEHCASAVSRSVVDDDHLEAIVEPLREHTLQRLGNRAFVVMRRNHDRNLHCDILRRAPVPRPHAGTWAAAPPILCAQRAPADKSIRYAHRSSR